MLAFSAGEAERWLKSACWKPTRVAEAGKFRRQAPIFRQRKLVAMSKTAKWLVRTMSVLARSQKHSPFDIHASQRPHVFLLFSLFFGDVAFSEYFCAITIFSV